MARPTWLLAALLCLGASAQTQTAADAIRVNVFQVLAESSNLTRQGDYDGALALLRSAFDGALTPSESVLVNKSLADTFMMAGDYDSATKHYRIVVDDPTGLDSAALNRVWYNMTGLHMKFGDYEGVVQVVAQWLERVDEAGPDAYKMLSFAHFQLGNRAAALEAGERYAALLREAGELVPSSFQTFLESLKRPEGEVSDISTSELSELAGPDTLRLLRRANDMMGIRNYKGAAVLLSNAIAAADATATEVAVLREKLAWALANRKDMEGAIEQLKAITQAPGRLPDEMLDKIWMRLASASYRAGAFEEALESTKTWRARTGKPDSDYYRLAAMSYWQLDDRESAVDHGRRYIELAYDEGVQISEPFKALFGDVLAEELRRD